MSSTGQWRDDRWGRVIAAMCGHARLGRMVLTSRRVPAGLDARVGAEAVDALSLDEALLLVRELPHLRSLTDGRLPGVDPAAAQSLARRVLNIAQGHPKLLELAEGQATDPARLGSLVKAGDEAWQQAGGLPEGFFATGQPQAAGEDYLHVLSAWTDAVADSLIPGHRDLFRFLCCLEQRDRIRPVTEITWAAVWTRLGRDGPPPELHAGLPALAARGLAAIQSGSRGTPESYGIHPGVAAAGRSGARTGFQRAVDAELAAYWAALADSAWEQESKQQASALVVRAGISAAPYLLRTGQWQVAGKLLERALGRDRSRAAAEVILPAVQATVAAAAGTKDGLRMAHNLVRVLEVTDRAAAGQQACALLVAARAQHDYRLASAAAVDLIRYSLADGRLAEARVLAGQNIRYIQKAQLGPWTRILGEVLRLQVQRATGRAGPAASMRRRKCCKSAKRCSSRARTSICSARSSAGVPKSRASGPTVRPPSICNVPPCVTPT